MLNFRPERHPKVASIIIAILLGVILALGVIAWSGIEYKVVSQSILFAVAAGIIYVITRYLIYQYTYTLTDDSFEVSRVAGRIPATLVSLEISENDLLVRITGRKDLKAYGVERTENVCANLAPHERLRAYITTINGRKTAILIETDELFALAIQERINMKKLSAKNEKDSSDEAEDQNGI